MVVVVGVSLVPKFWPSWQCSSQLAHIQNNKGKPFLSVFSGHSSDITHWFCPIKHSYFHAKNHIQKLTGQLKAIWMCDNCNNMPTGLSGKGLYCWILHLFHEEVFPLPSFTAVRNSLKKKVANLAQQYRAAFTLPFCAWGITGQVSFRQACLCVTTKAEKEGVWSPETLWNQWKMSLEQKRKIITCHNKSGSKL